jgi:hypothetical protein
MRWPSSLAFASITMRWPPRIRRRLGSGDCDETCFGGTDYVHRWSKNGQNEFTPPNDKDLDRWRDMVTINVNEACETEISSRPWPIRS